MLAIPLPVIDPVALQLGPVGIRWYALAYIVGLLGGWWYARRLVRAHGLWPAGMTRPAAHHLDDMLVWAALGVVLGGRLAYVLFYNFDYFATRPLEIFQLWRGGMAFHGGLAGAAAAIWIYARRNGLNPLSLFDVAAAVAPIGLFLGRVANFINGELWGRATDVPWAVIFPNAGPIPRHPSQLYEALTEGLLLFILLALLVRRVGFHRPGLLAGVFGIGYAVARIGCEMFREPDPQLGFLFGNVLTMGMLLSVPLGLLGALLVIRARRAPVGAGA